MSFIGKFDIMQKLPSLNDYINACRTNKYKGAKFKDDIETYIGWAIRQAMCEGKVKPTKKPIKITFIWHERTKRRDADNIASAKKYILDAMQKQGIIPNDSRKYVKGFTDEIVDDIADYVEVMIYEYK